MLRHACGFYLANKGVDTRTIQEYLGHQHPTYREVHMPGAAQVQGPLGLAQWLGTRGAMQVPRATLDDDLLRNRNLLRNRAVQVDFLAPARGSCAFLICP
jgi:hypothetical protein